MPDTRIIWCHGALSQPWGGKSKALAEVAASKGLTMEGPDFSDLENPDDRVKRLLDIIGEDDRPVILVGSSMGGYISCAAARHTSLAGLFLLAPALYLPGYDVHVFSGLPEHISITHGWDDDTVPVENAIRFGGLHRATLHLVPDGHRLADSIPTLEKLFADYLSVVLEQAA